MMCPHCGSFQTGCVESRQVEEIRWRRYRCLDCGERFKTQEAVRLEPEKKAICSQCLLKQEADALCLTCPLAKAAKKWRSKH